METEPRLSLSAARARLAQIAGAVGLQHTLDPSYVPSLDDHFPAAYWAAVDAIAAKSLQVQHGRIAGRDQEHPLGGGFPLPEYHMRRLGLEEQHFIIA